MSLFDIFKKKDIQLSEQNVLKDNMMNFRDYFIAMQNKYGEEFNWHLLTSDNKTFADEAYLEIGSGHPLYGVELQSIAKCDSNDDVLYIMDNKHYVIIHLTYSRNNSSSFPRYVDFVTFQETIEYLEKQYIDEYL